MQTVINAPYLRTTHTWTCQKGHETIVKDSGWPQRLSVRLAVQKAWSLHGSSEELRCPVCGGKVAYAASSEAATAPRQQQEATVVPLQGAAPAWPDFKAYGRAFYQAHRTAGGYAEARANAWPKRGQR